MRLIPRAWRRFFHVEKGRPYHEENSLRGAKEAIARGYRAIDWDVRCTKDGVMVLCHWARPMMMDGFFAPKDSGILRTARIEELTWAQVKTLRTRDNYRIIRVSTALRYAKTVGLARVELEAKDSPLLGFRETWLPVRRLARALRLDVQVKGLSTIASTPQNLAAAKAAGLVTILAVHSTLARSWANVADYYRGKIVWRR
jgi:hypothetical protein